MLCNTVRTTRQNWNWNEIECTLRTYSIFETHEFHLRIKRNSSAVNIDVFQAYCACKESQTRARNKKLENHIRNRKQINPFEFFSLQNNDRIILALYLFGILSWIRFTNTMSFLFGLHLIKKDVCALAVREPARMSLCVMCICATR